MENENVLAALKPGKACENNENAPEPGRSAIALQLAKRALASKSLDELFAIITNDLRCLIEFDRAFALSGNSGKPGVRAATNLVSINPKSKLIEHMNELSAGLEKNEKAILVTRRFLRSDPLGDSVAPQVKEAIRKHLIISQCHTLFTLPLIHRGRVQATVVLEFFERGPADNNGINELINIGSILAAAIYERTFEERSGKFLKITGATNRESNQATGFKRKVIILAAMAIFLPAILLIPFPVTVGGEAEVICRDTRIAFANLEGVLDKVLVRQGDGVEKGQPIARLDPTELNLRLNALESRFEILSQQMNQLSLESGRDPAKLARKKLLALKREGVSNEMRYLKWKRENLWIRSPAKGLVITDGISALEGKRMKSGERVCEIASMDKAQVVIYLPEERISGVKPRLPAHVYLNSDPTNPVELVISEISPYTEYHPRVGAAIRVFAEFKSTPARLKLGMKGIGKIKAPSSNLLSILYAKIQGGLNKISLYI